MFQHVLRRSLIVDCRLYTRGGYTNGWSSSRGAYWVFLNMVTSISSPRHELVNQQQVRHLPTVWGILLTLAYTPDIKAICHLGVSSERQCQYGLH